MEATNSKKCPFCLLINPASAERCDCGFIFEGNIVSPEELESGKRLRRKKGTGLIVAGFNSCCLGIILTLTVSIGASKAGIFVVFYGLVLAGIVLIFRGLTMILGKR